MDTVEKLFCTLLALLLCLLLVLLGYGIYKAVTDDSASGQFTLYESEWECTDTRIYYTTMLVGKVPVMQPHTLCTQYSKKQ